MESPIKHTLHEAQNVIIYEPKISSHFPISPPFCAGFTLFCAILSQINMYKTTKVHLNYIIIPV